MPTATDAPPRETLAAAMAVAVTSGMSYHSLCIMPVDVVHRTSWKVPADVKRQRGARPRRELPVPRRFRRRSAVPAVGAAPRQGRGARQTSGGATSPRWGIARWGSGNRTPMLRHQVEHQGATFEFQQRERIAPIRSTSACAPPASAMRMPGLNAWLARVLSARCVSSTRSISISARPPVALVPKRRASQPPVSLTTSRSPGSKQRRQVAGRRGRAACIAAGTSQAAAAAQVRNCHHQFPWQVRNQSLDAVRRAAHESPRL